MAAFGCEPDAFLGSDVSAPRDLDETSPAGLGGLSSGSGGGLPDAGGSPPLGDPLVIVEDGDGGAGGEGDDGLVQGHECSLIHPGEAHPEPIAVCCEMKPSADAWRDEVFIHINEVRLAADLPALRRDPALDQAAMGYAMHWSLHWLPEEKTGYPESNYRPSVVSAACGSEATLLMRTDLSDEPLLANGFIDPAVPADYWSTDRSLTASFHNPAYQRIGFAFYEGLLVNLMGRTP